MKLMWDGVEWGKYTNRFTGRTEHVWYLYWWNWLDPNYRYWGFEDFYYDQPHRSFGFWFFNWSWSTRWTPMPKDW